MLSDAIAQKLETNLSPVADNLRSRNNPRWVVKNQVIVKTNKPFDPKDLTPLANYINRKSFKKKNWLNNLIHAFRRFLRIDFIPGRLVPKLDVKKEDIIPCCWDQSLFLVINKEFYEAMKKEDRNGNVGDGTDGGTPMSPEERDDVGDGTDGGTPMSPEGGDTLSAVANYNDVVYVAHKDGSFDFNRQGGLTLAPCDSLVEQTNRALCDKHKEKSCKRHIKIGIIDLGFTSNPTNPSHADKIKKAIDSYSNLQNTNVIALDYNTLKVLDMANAFTVSCQIARGINENVDILNISLGYYSCIKNGMLKKYIKKAAQAGIFIVTSAGNDTNNNDDNFHWPSNFAKIESSVVSAAATENRIDRTLIASGDNHNDLLDQSASYSNYGETTVSCFESGSFDDNMTPVNQAVAQVSGSSYSAALVSAKVAYLFYRYGKSLFITEQGFDKGRILTDLGDNNIVP